MVNDVTQPLLEVKNLHTRFDTHRGVVRAVNGISFQIREGELVGLVGETGCGKSVTVRSVLGLVRSPGRIAEGEISYDGIDLRSLSRHDFRKLRGTGISFVPQNPWGALNPILRIERQFRNVIRAHTDASRQECWDMGLAMLQKVGIQGPERILKGYAHQLSGGMAQRVVMAIALVLNPRLVIADEPTTGLDVTIQRQILDMVIQLLEEERRAMLLVTHDLGVVAQYCHRVIVMYAGKIVEEGPVAEVFVDPAHPYTQALLAAIPRPGHKLVSLRGRVPSLIDYPTGCPFHDRCDFAFAPCSGEEPLLRSVSAGRHFACHLEKGVTEVDAR